MKAKACKLAIAAAAVIALLATSSQLITAEQSSPPWKAGDKDLLALAKSDPNLTTLTACLTAAEMTRILQGAGPYTIFAPDNAAFAKLPLGKLNDLLKPENKKQLVRTMKMHIVPGAIPSSGLKPGKLKTLEGKKVEVSSKDGKTLYDGSAVIAADRAATNGVIHVIDSVVLAK